MEEWDSRTRPTDSTTGGGSSGTTDDESVPAGGLVRETPVMRQEEPGRGDPIGLLDLRKLLPFEASAASDRLGWVGLEAARYPEAPASELSPFALTHHTLVLFARPPEELDLRYEGVKRYVPPPAGSISVVPAGSPARWRLSGAGRPPSRAR